MADLRRKARKRDMQVNFTMFFISMIFGALFLHNVYCNWSCSYDFTLNNLNFDSMVWISSRYGTPYDRYSGRMVYSLLDSVKLVGKSKYEVESILGKADIECNEIDKEEWSSELCYTLSLNEPHNIDYKLYDYHLCLYFDSTDTTRLVLLGRAKGRIQTNRIF